VKSFELKAPAKINLCLRVLERRADGFHNIDSLFFQISLYDRLRFNAADDFLFQCEGPDAGPDDRNLVVRAARLLQDIHKPVQGVSIHLRKEIPVGAGLGGGSSDAAAALLGLNLFWRLGLKPKELMRLGARLGSDVPFFLAGAAARVGGRGERVVPFVPTFRIPVLVVKPDCQVSTRWAYETLSLTKGGHNYKLPCSAGMKSGLRGLVNGLFNDFEAGVFRRYPEVADIKSRLISAGAEGAVMTGSGSAVVGVFNSLQKAEEASARFSGEWRFVAQTLAGMSPLPNQLK